MVHGGLFDMSSKASGDASTSDICQGGMDRARPRAAYVHVPFCQHHCGYCSFTVLAGHDALIPDYLEAVERELALLQAPQPVETLYLGGGSPSHLPIPALERLLELLAAWFPLVRGGEFTVEVNPGEFDAACGELLRHYGVNRISVGAQSLRADKLRRLDRKHDPADVRLAVDVTRRMGAHVAIDLIFAAEQESSDAWRSDLQAMLQLEPDHVSTYGLTLEKGTRFWTRRLHGTLEEVDEEAQRTMYLTAMEVLGEAGFDHYEVSNFARPGHRSRHNMTYWLGESYYGVGPGAARYVGGIRELNHRSTSTYIRRLLAGASPTAEREELSREARARERLVFGLRMLEGVDVADFARQTGFTLEELAASSIEWLVGLGMLARSGTRLQLTRQGLLVSDSLWPYLL